MGRLIDGDSFEAGIKILFGESNPIIHIVINKLHDQPTVEAIPKADYENRLKADMVAMLEDLDLQIDELAAYNLEVAKVQRLIRDRIDKLKENKKWK